MSLVTQCGMCNIFDVDWLGALQHRISLALNTVLRF